MSFNSDSCTMVDWWKAQRYSCFDMAPPGGNWRNPELAVFSLSTTHSLFFISMKSRLEIPMVGGLAGRECERSFPFKRRGKNLSSQGLIHLVREIAEGSADKHCFLDPRNRIF